MDLNTIKLSLSSVLIILLTLSCIDSTRKKATTQPKVSTDTCKVDPEKAEKLGSNISCMSCHTQREGRITSDLFTMKEVSNMDSLKLRDFLFITRHKKNLILYKDATIAKQRLRRIDSLSECDRKNLIHYIKEYNRPHVYILSTLPDSLPKK